MRRESSSTGPVSQAPFRWAQSRSTLALQSKQLSRAATSRRQGTFSDRFWSPTEKRQRANQNDESAGSGNQRVRILCGTYRVMHARVKTELQFTWHLGRCAQPDALDAVPEDAAGVVRASSTSSPRVCYWLAQTEAAAAHEAGRTASCCPPPPSYAPLRGRFAAGSCLCVRERDPLAACRDRQRFTRRA